MNLCLSNQEKNFVIDGIHDGLRNDGRNLLDYRPIYLETRVLSTTNGSAKVQIGSTTVLIAVKTDMNTVEDTTLCENKLRFFVDFSAVASPIFVGKGGNDYGEEIANTLSNAYNNENAIGNLSKLVLGRTFMWTVFVDVIVLQRDGSVIDAISIGVKAALATAEISEMIVRPADQGKQILDLPDECKTWFLDVSRAPLLIGVSKIGDQSVVDTTNYEDACSTNALIVAVESAVEDDGTKDSRIVGLRTQKGGCLDLESVEDMINTAVYVAKALNKAVMARLREERIAAEKLADVESSAPMLRLMFR